ncbi:MAG: hypothetical protein K6G85_09060 [Eubacterium sp.]|nr:hypothetical protein [Eubacterium sp.]
MIWYNDLYVGYNLLERKREVIRKMKWGKQQFNVFVITLSRNEHDLLEIYPSNVLTQKYYKDSDLVVVGIAYGKEEAYDMMQLVLTDCMEETGGLDVKQYILSQMNG